MYWYLIPPRGCLGLGWPWAIIALSCSRLFSTRMLSMSAKRLFSPHSTPQADQISAPSLRPLYWSRVVASTA